MPAMAGGDDVSQDDFENEPMIEFMEKPEEDLPESSPQDKKEQLWHDPADDTVSVSLKSSKRMRKLARGKGGKDRVNGGALQSKLREQYVAAPVSITDHRFERLHPKPEWAFSRLDSKVPTMQRLLASTASFISIDALGDGHRPLPTTTIDIQRLHNANAAAASEGGSSSALAGIVDLAWHPSAKMPVLTTAGTDRRVRFYNVC